MLLCGDWVVPVSSPPIADGAVVVAEGAIEAVGPAAELKRRHPAEEVREFPGCGLLPGLVNAHTHLEYSAFRDFAPSCGFGEWVLRLLLARRKLGKDEYAASALWGAYECARSGITSIADTTYEGWTVARAAGAAGLRARVYLEVFGLDDSQLPATMQRLEAGLDRLRREYDGARGGAGDAAPRDDAPAEAGGRGACAGRVGGAGPPVEWGISPHAPYTVSARLYRETARFARRAGLRLATHVAESQAEVELLLRGTGPIAFAYKAAHLWTGQRWAPPGKSPVEYVARSGGLGPDVLVVHAVQIDGADIGALAESGAAVAHCPRSNQRLECGIAPVAELIGAGVRVGLGTDGLCSNDDLDMFAEMRAALKVSRERALRGARAVAGAGAGGAPGAPAAAEPAETPLTPATVLRMATLDGARALGWDHLTGSLEAGKRADIIAVWLPNAALPGAGPLHGAGAAAVGPRGRAAADPTAALVGYATAADVHMTMVDGIVLCASRSLPGEVVRGFEAARAKLGLR